MWLEVRWAGQDLPGGSARCLVPLSTGREPGTPLLQPPAPAPLGNPGCFPSKVCVPQCCLCLLSSLPSFLSPFSSPFSLSLPSALHESLSSGLCTKLRSPHLCFWTCPCIQVTVGSPPPMWAMLALGRAQGAHPAALLCLLPPCGLRGRARFQEMLCKPDRGNWGTGKVTRRVPGCPEVQVGAQKCPWRDQGAGRGAWRALGSLTDSESPEVLEGPGKALGAREGRRRTLGYSEHAQRPQAPQKPLGRLWGCTHSHRKGGVGKSKCHSVPLQKGHLEGSVGRTWGSGMQHKAGRGSWGTATASSMPRGFLGTPGAGLWPWGSGS